MKKLVLVIPVFVIICACSAICAQTDEFVQSFMTCTPYRENNRSEMFGMEVTSSLEVLGRRGGLCGFRSSINTQAGSANIECNFTDEQIAELVGSMQANASEIEAVARQGLDSNPQIGENPAVVIFNKYFTDTSVCSVTN